jgi:NDP-sugar pyrophosphorylase family protein
MPLPVVILAGGLATRLGPLTKQIPKSLIDVSGKPFAVHQIELLQKHGFNRIVFCVGYLGKQIQAALGDGSRWGVDLKFVFDELNVPGSQTHLLGTGGAIKHALPLLGEAFLVLYGDTYLLCDYVAVIKEFQESGTLGLMTVFRNSNQWDHSNVLFTENKILRYDKHHPSADMQYIDYGLGVLCVQAFDPYPEDQPFDLVEVYQDLVRKNELAGYEVTQRFYEIGTLSGLEETRRFLSGCA